MKQNLLVARTAIGAMILLLVVETAAGQKTMQLSLPASNQEVVFNVFLPPRNSNALEALISSQHAAGSSNYRQWLTATAFRNRFGANPDDIARVASTLTAYGLTITNTIPMDWTVRGTAHAMEAAFSTNLREGVDSRGRHRLISTTPLKLPSGLNQTGAQVFSFSPVVRQHAHSRRLDAIPANRNSSFGGYWFTDIKQAYDFPSYLALTGKGRNIGIVMANDFLDSDMVLYFGHEGLPVPTIRRVPIDGGAAFDPDLSLETSLDIQQAGGMAPGATIILYNIPDLSDASILDAYLTIVETNAVDIVNSSFGGAEGFYTPAYNDRVDQSAIVTFYDDIFRHGNALGITFVASSGDSGALALPSVGYVTTPPQKPPVVTAEFLPGIELPASSPHVVAVGGTNLQTIFNPPSLESNYISENAMGDPEVPYDPYGVGNLVAGGWWGSGGGPSIFFSKPLFQFLVNTGTNMRAIPDISLQMGGCPGGILSGPCPPDRSYSIVTLGGVRYGVIGTSISSPDFAGLLALAEENLGVRLAGC